MLFREIMEEKSLEGRVTKVDCRPKKLLLSIENDQGKVEEIYLPVETGGNAVNTFNIMPYQLALLHQKVSYLEKSDSWIDGNCRGLSRGGVTEHTLRVLSGPLEGQTYVALN